MTKLSTRLDRLESQTNITPMIVWFSCDPVPELDVNRNLTVFEFTDDTDESEPLPPWNDLPPEQRPVKAMTEALTRIHDQAA